MKDTFGRDINYLRLSVTDLCQLRCQYCMPPTGIQKKSHDEMLTIEEMFFLVEAFVGLGVTKIRLTGGEPLLKKGLLTLIKSIRKMPEITDLALTTNGLLLSDMAEDLKNAGLMRVNISLDSLDPHRYNEITRGGSLEQALAGIAKAKEVGFKPIKINTVLIGGFNEDEMASFIQWTYQEPIEVRFIELMPIGEAATWSKDNYLKNEDLLMRYKNLMPLPVDDPSSAATYYQIPGAKGKIGLISPISCQFCKDCNRLRLTADGHLKMCLHSNEEIDLKSLLRSEQYKDPQALAHQLEQIILNKPLEHGLNKGHFIHRNMGQIGG